MTGVQHCCEQVGVSLARSLVSGAGCQGRPAGGQGISAWLLSGQGSASGSFCPSPQRARSWHLALGALPVRPPSRPPSSRLFHRLFLASSRQGGSASRNGLPAVLTAELTGGVPPLLSPGRFRQLKSGSCRRRAGDASSGGFPLGRGPTPLLSVLCSWPRTHRGRSRSPYLCGA